MRVTVVIPAYNEAQYLRGCLTCLGQQTLGPANFEVIVVDNGSTDETVSIAREVQRGGPFAMQVLSNPKTSISAVRNLGARQAQGDMLAFLDADCVPDPDWLEQAVRLAPASGAWGAHYRIPENATWVGRVWFEYQAKVGDGSATYLPGGDIFLWRREFEALGGFNENVRTSEDVELCSRVRAAGMPVCSISAIAVVHLGTPQTLARFYRQHRWHGQEVLRLFLKNLPSRKNLPLVFLSAYTFLMVGLVLLGLIAAMWTRVLWYVFAPLGFLLLPSFLIAGLKALTAKSLTSFFSLWTLYLVYFLARAASLRYVVLPRTDGGRVKT